MNNKIYLVLLMLVNLFTFNTAYAETIVTINGLTYSLSGAYASVNGMESGNLAKSIIIPSVITYDGLSYTVNSIANYAFRNKTQIEEVKLPNTIKSIGYQAFNKANNLKSVSLNDGITDIGNSAFRETAITEMIIPKTVITIGSQAFYDCNYLRTLIYLGATPPKDWTATSQTYVPNKEAYGNPYTSINNASVQEMLTMSENTFTYSGKTPDLTWTNNVQGYNVSYNIPTVQKIVGTYNEVLVAHFTNGSNSFSVEIPYSYTINPATLIAKVKNATKEYGEANPQFQTVYSGFVAGENESVITNYGTYSTSATTNSNAGNYIVTQSGATAQNYTFQYEAGQLTITKVPLTMTASNVTMTYGDRVPTLTADYSGLKNNQTAPAWTVTPTITTIATSTSNAGTYPIIITEGVAKNYDVTFNPGVLTIEKASLTAITQNATREYGEDNPNYAMTYTGLKNSETSPNWTVAPIFSTEANKYSPVGTYTISAMNGETTNYDVQFVNKGVLTITKASLTVKARSYTKYQGEENPTFAVDYTGFKNNETKLALSQEPITTTTATTNSRPGTYPITVSGGQAINYNLKYVNGTLTILPNDTPGDQTDNVISIDNIRGAKNRQVLLPISLKNKDQITGLQMDLYLPDGVTVALNSRGRPQIETTSRMDGNYSITGSVMDGFVRIVGYSPDTDPFLGNDGDIINVTLDIASNISVGNYTIRLKDIVLSDVNNKEYHPADVGAVLTVSNYTLGDVDNSGAVNINDVVCIINHILNKTNGTFIEEAADVDGSGVININDVVTLINRYILHRTSAPKRAPRAAADGSEISDRLYIGDISIVQGETMEIAVQLDNADEVRAVQGNIKLPAGLKFVTRANGRLDVQNLEERSEDFTLSCALQEDGSMTFAHYSPYGFAYEGNNGGIFTFKIEADNNAEPGEYQMDLKDVVISVNGVGYDMPAQSSALTVTIPAPNPDGVDSVNTTEPFDVYNIAGVKVRSQVTTTADLPAGIYIINGKKVFVK